MRTLNNPQASGNVTEARPQLEDVAARIEEVLQHFNVLSSKADRHIVRYAYLYLLGSGLLLTVLYMYATFSKFISNSSFTRAVSFVLLASIGTSLILGVFNVWQVHVPHILRDVFERRRISVPTGDVSTAYLGFLEHYRNALRSPRRYLLIGSLEIILAIFLLVLSRGYLDYIQLHPNIVDTVLLGIDWLLTVLVNLGVAYCFGVGMWALIISGWHIRELSRAFEFRIEPLHPDHCGDLRLLGNFCFGAASPLFVGVLYESGYTYMLIALRDSSDTALVIGFSVFLFLLVGLPIAIVALILPLWNIHTKMLRERETEEENYVANRAMLREQIRMLLADNRLEEAKAVQEKKELLEAEYIPYPTWPFNVRAKFFATVLGASGSFVLGILTALPSVIFQVFFHVKP